MGTDKKVKLGLLYRVYPTLDGPGVGRLRRRRKKRLKAFVYLICDVFKPMVATVSKIALLSSFSIFAARAEPSWSVPNLIYA